MNAQETVAEKKIPAQALVGGEERSRTASVASSPKGEDGAGSASSSASRGRSEKEARAAKKPGSRRHIDLGRRGEDAAARFLDRRGYDIVERNWTCIAGEADIIARDGETVVFVEVKTRSTCDKGFPSEAVDADKRERYENIAALFLQGFDVVDVPVRFDIVAIVAIAPDRALIRHHINAFSAA